MDKVNISEDILDEVEEIIDINKEKTEGVESSVIFDGRQYTLKIPKKIADKVGIDPAKDKFIFQIKTYPIEEQKDPELTIDFKRGNDKK